ncbi:hypothetical protein SERLA73DRAFT_183142 [Serpula lacrymans var. lacrymans S7.3]|uniref:Uncharacterized protein n=2 Tax=Serpula lacrymans var. lacrymans TaxID=341189 RepID=F8Q1P5_SERL3|nr:uncharacterized protein SERLADRAFT_470150 [Serpula lacrymans var. lacrymans S7.9]EGN98223.1 hypothetical protein SERLA73DRAFT_183142 [Serpula lacrymans var. lacrymans S7.3]EGO23797.1 hypothetical protein SERLADRAFT_470150 [Serpula lacrymans var. lacrymans S7.9]
MWAVSILMLVYHIWDCINPNMAATTSKSVEAIKSTILFVAPYLTLTVFTISAAFLSILHPTRVNRDRLFFYCSLDYSPFSDAMLGFVIVTCLAILAIKARLAVILYRNWRGIRHAGYASNIDVQLIFRVLVFGVYVCLGLIVSLLSISNAMSAFPNMFAATIGIVISLLFGTQHDVLHAWFYWVPVRIHFEKKTIYFTRNWSPNFEIIKPSVDTSKPLPAIPDKVLVIGRSNEHGLRLDSERAIQSIA